MSDANRTKDKCTKTCTYRGGFVQCECDRPSNERLKGGPVRCVNHDYYSDTYCPWCRAERAETELERLTRLEANTREVVADYWEEICRLRAALDEAFSILHIALPCPRPWPTEGDEAKLRIFRNIAEDRRPAVEAT